MDEASQYIKPFHKMSREEIILEKERLLLEKEDKTQDQLNLLTLKLMLIEVYLGAVDERQKEFDNILMGRDKDGNEIPGTKLPIEFNFNNI